MADAAVTGLLQGKTITLDAPVPPLDGQRVHVIITPANEAAELSREEQARLWEEWVRRGTARTHRGRRRAGIPVINRGDIRWFRFAAPDKRRAGADPWPPGYSSVAVSDARNPGLDDDARLVAGRSRCRMDEGLPMAVRAQAGMDPNRRAQIPWAPDRDAAREPLARGSIRPAGRSRLRALARNPRGRSPSPAGNTRGWRAGWRAGNQPLPRDAGLRAGRQAERRRESNPAYCIHDCAAISLIAHECRWIRVWMDPFGSIRNRRLERVRATHTQHGASRQQRD